MLVISWPNILYPIAGTLLAMMFSILPGLSGLTLMALAIPFTYAWEPLPVLLIYGAFVGGATFMGSITAILFNIPGRNSSAATMLDGYPLAQQGQSKTAIGCSAAASALGSTFGVIVLVLMIPLMRDAVLLFGPPEFLMLAVWGLMTIGVLARGSVIKGLITACIGLLLAFVGFDPRTAELRYTFDGYYLRDGISPVPVFLGIFALAEMIHLAASGRHTISGNTRLEELSGSVWKGCRAVFEHFGLFVRSSVIGTVVGMIPGIGATVASFVAYGHAAQSAGKDSSKFGRGDIRGVLAPEAANDAKDGGSLMPTLAFGIPGGAGTALLLVVLGIHGLAPGKQMLGDNLTLTFVLIWSMFISNWLTSLLGVAAVNPLARLTIVRTQLLIPVIVVLAILGAYIYEGRFGDVILAFVFGVVGYYMRVYGWPRIPLVVALVLGPLFENSLHITLKLHQLDRIDFWTRPITLVLVTLCIVSLALPSLQVLWSRSRIHKSDD